MSDDFESFFVRMGVGGMVRRLREREEIRQYRLADSMNVSQSMISRIENGRRMPDIRTLARIAVEMRTTLTITLGGETATFDGNHVATRRDDRRRLRHARREVERLETRLL